MSWNSLLVRENIGRFAPLADPSLWNYLICHNHVESQLHLFLACPFVKITWRNQKWPLDTAAFCNLSISYWIRILLRANALLGIPCNDVFEFLLTAAIVIDLIWFAQNQLIHKNVIPEIPKALKTNTNVIRNHLLAWKTSSFGLSFWCPPPCGTLKLNFDVATKDDFVVIATVHSNDKGDILLPSPKS